MTARYALLIGLLLALFVALPTRADAPAGRYTFPASGTVYDTRTKLTWQQSVDAGTYTPSGAATYCSGLTLAALSWRAPTVEELETLVDDTKYNPAIDTTAFPNTPTVWFWSATPVVGPVGDGWMVHFGTGYSINGGVSNSLRVRCVH